ncbi:tape measure protein [Lactobacillus acetotolerans]|uniref:tape measure protein n=1 Tax=Lactobacillus acetotolerans TaxID=1600 RepID=UPI002FD9934D
MSGKIPAGEFNTRISLDGAQPIQTMKSLKAEVSGLTNAWKAHEIQLKSAGDSLGAAKAKYEGLTQSVDKQKTVLERLKAEQSGIDQSTTKGAESYAKLGNQIESASRKLASMEAQQNRAKSTMTYYKSGIADAQNELERISSTSKAYVTRLEAEGRQEQANAEKMKGLKSEYAQMTTIYEKQANELKRIEQESGRNTDAYARQSVRVNELGTKMAETRTKMAELNGAVKQVPTSPIERLKSALTGTRNETEKAHSSFKTFLGANLVSNALTTGITMLGSKIRETVKSGIDLNEAGEALKNTWAEMGKSTQDIAGLSTQMSDLRAKTGDSALEVNTLQKAMDTLTNGNTSQTIALTKGVAAIGTASHLSGSQVDGLGKSMTRVVASGDLTAQSLARLEKAAPSMGSALARAAGVSQEKFNSMVQNGDISSKKFLQLISTIGQNSDSTFKRFGKTSEGALAQIQGGWMTLKAKMTAPLLEVKNSGMSELAGILTSSAVQKGATDLGVAIAHIAEKGVSLLGYIADHKEDITGIASSGYEILKIAGSTVWDVFSTTIETIADAFGLTGDKAKNAKDPLDKVNLTLQDIAKNKELIQDVTKALMAMFAIKKATEFIKVLNDMRKVLLENAAIEKVLGNGSFFGGGGSLGKLGKAGKVGKVATEGGEVASTVETAESTGGAVAGFGSKALGVTAKLTRGLGALDAGRNVGLAGVDIVKAISEKNPDSKFRDYGKGAGTVLGTGIGAVVGGPIGAAIGGVVGKEVGPLGGKAAKNWIKGWNDYGTKHKPKNFVEKLGSGTHKVTKSVGDSYSKSLQAETAQKMAQAGVSSKQTKAKSNDPYAGLSKSVKKLLKDSNTSFNGITSGFIKMNNTTAKESAKAEKTEESSYKKLTTSLSKYYKDKEGKSKKDLQTLVKNGSITQKQANADLKKQKANDKQKQKVITDSYKAIQKLETKYGTQRKKLSDKLNSQETAALKKTKTANQKILDQYEKKYGKDSSKYQKEKEKLDKKYNAQKAKLDQSNNKKLEKQHATYLANIGKAEQKANATLEKNINTSSSKQQKILEKLSKNKQKLSHDEMLSIIKDSQKQRDQQIDDADKVYDHVVKKANDQYKDTLQAAKKKRDDVIAAAKYEHDTEKTMSDDQYTKIVNNAKKTYTESVAQAKAKKTDTVNEAKTEKEQSTTKAKEMHKNVVDEATKQAKEHKDAVVDEKNNVNTNWDKMRNSMSSTFNNIVDSITGILKGMGMGNSTIPRWKKYATGSSGTLEDEIAVVGEEGFELAHTPGKGIYPLGVKGQETRFIPKGTSILPHEQSKQFLAMTSQLPHHALGIPGQITDWFGDVLGKGKELASDLGGMIEKGATFVLSRIEDKVGLKAFVDSFNNAKGTGKYNLAHGSRNTVLTQAAKYLQEFFNKWMAEHAGGSGSRGEFLKNAIKFSKGKPYVWGAAGPDSFDCSGLVMYTLAKMGVDFPHFSGAQFNKTKAVAEKDAKVGDLSFYGSGGSEHVGIVSDPRKKKMWAAQSPSNNPNIGYDDIHNGLPFAGIRRVTQLHDEGAGGDYADTIREAAEIMKQKVTDFNVDMISRIIKNESGGNPKAINLWDSNAIAGHPSKGILQFIQPTFDHYKMAGHGDIYNPLDQLIALFNDSTWRSDMGMGYNGKYGEWRGNASGPSGSPIHPNHQFANGGLATEASIFGEAGPEMAIPMSAVKSSRGYELLGKTAAAFAARDTVNGDSDSEVVTTLKNIETLLTMVLGQDNDDLTGQAQITVENPINLDGKKLANGITNKYVLPKITDALKKGRQKLSGV